MSDNLSAIHTQATAILEKLYNEKGQPNELDETFSQQYFTLLQQHLDLKTDEDKLAFKGPKPLNVRLSQPDGGLVDILIPLLKKKFLVSTLQSVKTLPGYWGFGTPSGKGSYVMTSIQGMVQITVKSNNSVVSFLVGPGNLQTETGQGEWVDY